MFVSESFSILQQENKCFHIYMVRFPVLYLPIEPWSSKDIANIWMYGKFQLPIQGLPTTKI